MNPPTQAREIKERGFTLYQNGDLLKDDENDFIVHGASFMLKEFNISLVGLINALNDKNLFYGNEGWQFKKNPPKTFKACWSQFSQKWNRE